MQRTRLVSAVDIWAGYPQHFLNMDSDFDMGVRGQKIKNIYRYLFSIYYKAV